MHWLPRTIPAPPDRPQVGGPDHPIRRVTREIAFDAAAWTPERAGKVAALFDQLAEGWEERGTPERLTALRDALARGELAGETVLELGCGTAHATKLLAERFRRVVAIDLSREMLRRARAQGGADFVRGDASRLPVASASFDVVVQVNMLLFPREVARVLTREGALLFVSSLGDATPIYLPPEDVARALPGSWDGLAAEAGWGTWSVHRRAADPPAA